MATSGKRTAVSRIRAKYQILRPSVYSLSLLTEWIILLGNEIRQILCRESKTAWLNLRIPNRLTYVIYGPPEQREMSSYSRISLSNALTTKGLVVGVARLAISLGKISFQRFRFLGRDLRKQECVTEKGNNSDR